MKFYSYQIAKEEQDGEEVRLVFSGVMKQATPETLEIAKREAYNGEYEIIDDGEPEPEPSTESILLELAADHEARLCEIELGV